MNQCVSFIAELSVYASNGGVVGTTLTNRRPSLHPFFSISMLPYCIVAHLLAENNPIIGNFTMRKCKMMRFDYWNASGTLI